MIPSSQFPSRFHAIAKIQNGCHWRDIWHILLVPSSQINLAILFMDKLEQIAFSSCRLVSPYKRYVDVIYLQTAKWREGKWVPRHHEQSTPETKNLRSRNPLHHQKAYLYHYLTCKSLSRRTARAPLNFTGNLRKSRFSYTTSLPYQSAGRLTSFATNGGVYSRDVQPK